MKPKTPLPWMYERLPGDNKSVLHRLMGGAVIGPYDVCIVSKNTLGASPGTGQDFHYIVHAANLYPELVDFIASLESDAGQLPPFMAKWRTELLAKAKGE